MTLSCPNNNGVRLASVEKQMIAQKPVLETMDAAREPVLYQPVVLI